MNIPNEVLIYGGAGVASLIGLIALYKGASKVINYIRGIEYNPVLGAPFIAAAWGGYDLLNGHTQKLAPQLSFEQIKELVQGVSAAAPDKEAALINALDALSQGITVGGVEGYSTSVLILSIMLTGCWIVNSIFYLTKRANSYPKGRY